MDFDLKYFFEQPPRFKEEVKVYMHSFATEFVKRAALHAKVMKIERMLARHVPLIAFAMSEDPVTRYTSKGLCMQQHKIKSVLKIFQRALADVNQSIRNDPKYGNIDKKIVKGTAQVLELEGVRASPAAVVYLAACLGEICGIMLNCTQLHMQEQKTVSLTMLKQMSMTHQLSTGEWCINVSLMRFIHSIFTSPPSLAPNAEKSKSSAHKRSRDAARSIEERSVSFADDSGANNQDEWVPCATAHDERKKKSRGLGNDQRGKEDRVVERPSTPEWCFWEEDV